MNARWINVPLLALFSMIGTGLVAPDGGHPPNPEVWFIPNGKQDFHDMWRDDAPWQSAAQKVNVLGIIHYWLLEATDHQILALADFAARRNIKLALEIEPISRFLDQACGRIEGYTAPETFPAEMAVLKRLTNIPALYVTV